MYVVINELFVRPENRVMFERNFPASMQGTLPGVPGLSSARLLRPEEADRGYLSVLEFVDDAAYNAYQASDSFRAAHTWPDHASVDGSRLTPYHVRTEIAGTAAAGRQPDTELGARSVCHRLRVVGDAPAALGEVCYPRDYGLRRFT